MIRCISLKRITGLIVAGAFAFYAQGVAAQYTPVTVLLSVNADETGLDIKSPSQCASGGKKGCVEAAKNKKIRIKVVMRGNAKCSSGGKWALSQVFLGGENSPNKPSSWGGLVMAANDFDVNPQTGLVTPENGSNGNQLKFINQNSQPYDIWYKVTATCNGRTIEMDPRIKNRGRG